MHRWLAFACAFALALATPLQTSAQQLPNMPPDNTGGNHAHMVYEGAIGAGVHLALPERPWLANGLCFAVGLAKEVSDYRRGQAGYRHGLFSRNDLKADALGCALGWATAAGVRVLLQPRGASFNLEF
jgi:hypothetical protein